MNTKVQRSFQLFNLSNEESNCPLIPHLIDLGLFFYQIGILTENMTLTMSAYFGKRIIINTTEVPMNKLSRNDFIEIVDVDPVKKIILFIGPKQPHEITPLHWIVHRAKPQIVTTVMILDETNSLHHPKIKNQTIHEENTLFDTAKRILKTLQKTSVIPIENKGVFIAGNSFDDVKKQSITTWGK